MRTVFSQSKKRRPKRQASKGKPSRSRRRQTQVQALEQRKLLAADGFDMAVAGEEVPAQVSAVVASASAHAIQSDAIRFDRIVNGTSTQDFEAVGIVNDGCSGTLIAPNAVLTAAHCIFDPTGEQTFSIGGKTYTGTQAIVHPEYGSNDIDLAVILLSENVTGVTPMELNRTEPQVGQMLTLVGFGGQGTAAAGHDGSFGIKNVGQTPLDLVTATSIEWDYDNASESNTAPGDSGGPAFVEVDGKFLIAGVTSGGTQANAGLGDHSFDTRVDVFAEWIDSAVAGAATGGGPVVDSGGGDVGDDGGGVDLATAEQLAKEELDWLDTNQDGSVSRDEMIAGYTDAGDSGAEAAEFADYLIEDYDADGDGSLNLEELIASYGPADAGGDDTGGGDPVDGDPVDGDLGDGEVVGMDLSAIDLAKEELADFDTDGDGALSRDELLAELTSYGASIDEAGEEADWLLEDFDANQDGQLDLGELTASWSDESVDGDWVGDDPVDDEAVDDHSGSGDFGDDGFVNVDGMITDDIDDQVGDPIEVDGGHTMDPFGGCDVNLDGAVSPLDALLLINQLAEFWISQLESGESNPFDVNSDGQISPLDAMMVIIRIADQSMGIDSPTSQMMQHDDANDWRQSREASVDHAFAASGSLF